MIQEYVNKLIDNLPDDIKNVTTPTNIDVILDGGIFNGSYLVGALYFLKEMEKRNYIRVDRISGCSIGSIAGFLYFIDGLDLMSPLYEIVNTDFRKTYRLTIVKELKHHLKDHIPDNICDKLNGRFFVTYNNVKKGEKSIKSQYKNIDDVINTIIRSSYIPFLIDGNVLYENKYIDGINPYIFNDCSTPTSKKILYLDLFGYDKIGNLLNVKNEKSNYHRILSGLLDIHSFFIKQSNTPMCSYVNDWNITNVAFQHLKWLIERIMLLMVRFLLYVKDKVPEEYKSTTVYKILSTISYDIFIVLLEQYCL